MQDVSSRALPQQLELSATTSWSSASSLILNEKILLTIGSSLLLLGLARAKRCTVESSNGASDDSPAIQAALEDCAEDSVIHFTEDADYNVFNPVAANLTNVTIDMQGNLHLSQNITHMQ